MPRVSGRTFELAIDIMTVLAPHAPSSALRRAPALCRWIAAVVGMASLTGALGCATVRPEQRAVLADPKMRFQGDPRASAQLEHALQNREGAQGGGAVQGGGCGCN
jgi:hypothetical protein